MVKSVRPSISNRPGTRSGKNKRAPKIKSRTFNFDEKRLIVCRRPKETSEEEFEAFLNHFAQDVLKRHQTKTIIVGVNHWNEIRVLDPDELRDIGFVHVDEVFLLKKDVDLSLYSEQQIAELATMFMPSDEEE